MCYLALGSLLFIKLMFNKCVARSDIEQIQCKLLFKQKMQNLVYPFSIWEQVFNVSDLADNLRSSFNICNIFW